MVTKADLLLAKGHGLGLPITAYCLWMMYHEAVEATYEDQTNPTTLFANGRCKL